jgi:hypothetical protein
MTEEDSCDVVAKTDQLTERIENEPKRILTGKPPKHPVNPEAISRRKVP